MGQRRQKAVPIKVRHDLDAIILKLKNLNGFEVYRYNKTTNSTYINEEMQFSKILSIAFIDRRKICKDNVKRL